MPRSRTFFVRLLGVSIFGCLYPSFIIDFYNQPLFSSLSFFVSSAGLSLALSGEITSPPISSSNRLRVSPANLPPRFATERFSANVSGCSFFESVVVVTSASIFKTSSISVILSRRFSFLSPLSSLYSLTVRPLHAFVISSVSIAYSTPSFTPRSFHSSVSFLRISIV